LGENRSICSGWCARRVFARRDISRISCEPATRVGVRLHEKAASSATCRLTICCRNTSTSTLQRRGSPVRRPLPIPHGGRAHRVVIRSAQSGVTVYLMNVGLLEHAQQMAAHESARTTKLYDRRNDKVTSMRWSGSCCRAIRPSTVVLKRVVNRLSAIMAKNLDRLNHDKQLP
jgi:hypothetical protein